MMELAKRREAAGMQGYSADHTPVDVNQCHEEDDYPMGRWNLTFGSREVKGKMDFSLVMMNTPMDQSIVITRACKLCFGWFVIALLFGAYLFCDKTCPTV